MTEKPTMASRLPLAARKRAVNFILEKGNNLQRMRYAFHFADGGADSVLGALRNQTAEGCWVPRWSWSGAYPATWKVVATEIKVELTLRFLMQPKRFDLFDSS